MKKAATVLIRVIGVAVATTLAGGLVTVYLGDIIPPRVHSWIIGGLAVLFSISEAHFRSLISELSNIQRRGSYSVWQVEKLSDLMPQVRANVWTLWSFTLWLKALAGIAAAALQWDALKPEVKTLSVFVGYSALSLSFIISLWAKTNYRRIEDLCNRIIATEVSKKEKRKMHKEIESGEPHDFEHDSVIQGYSKPSKRPLKPAT